MSDKLEYVQRGVNDVYFGRGEKFTVGDIEFDRCGFKYAGGVRDCNVNAVKVYEDRGFIWVELYSSNAPVVVVGIPIRHITI